jgi:hypothetical protein
VSTTGPGHCNKPTLKFWIARVLCRHQSGRFQFLHERGEWKDASSNRPIPSYDNHPYLRSGARSHLMSYYTSDTCTTTRRSAPDLHRPLRVLHRVQRMCKLISCHTHAPFQLPSCLLSMRSVIPSIPARNSSLEPSGWFAMLIVGTQAGVFV